MGVGSKRKKWRSQHKGEVMSLYIKHRPKDIKRFVGNEATINALYATLNKPVEDIPHAFLFTGPSGCGKTTLGRIVRTHLNCHDADFYEVNAADMRGIDNVREIQRQMLFRPSSGPCRIWLIDECHQLTKEAQSSLLKALEDTPSHVYFILATTDPGKLLPTIRTRCSSFEVRALQEEELIKVMRRVLKRESKEIHEDVLSQIARDATGSARMALVILEKIIDLSPDQQMEAAKQRALEENQVIELCRLMFKGTDWSAVTKVLSNLKEEPESIRRAILGYCNSILMKKKDMRAYVVMCCFRENYYDTARAGLTMSCFEAVESSNLK